MVAAVGEAGQISGGVEGASSSQGKVKEGVGAEVVVAEQEVEEFYTALVKLSRLVAGKVKCCLKYVVAAGDELAFREDGLLRQSSHLRVGTLLLRPGQPEYIYSLFEQLFSVPSCNYLDAYLMAVSPWFSVLQNSKLMSLRLMNQQRSTLPAPTASLHVEAQMQRPFFKQRKEIFQLDLS